jgi:hypothetical protein
VFSSDRAVVERAGGTATLRRWYLIIAQGAGLGVMSFGGVDLLHRLLQQALAPSIGSTTGIGTAVASLIAGLAIWLPHHLWSRPGCGNTIAGPRLAHHS